MPQLLMAYTHITSAKQLLKGDCALVHVGGGTKANKALFFGCHPRKRWAKQFLQLGDWGTSPLPAFRILTLVSICARARHPARRRMLPCSAIVAPRAPLSTHLFCAPAKLLLDKHPDLCTIGAMRSNSPCNILAQMRTLIVLAGCIAARTKSAVLRKIQTDTVSHTSNG